MNAPDLNLLPWRERQERRAKINYWLVLSVCILLPCLLASALNLQARSELHTLRQSVRQASEEREIATGLIEQRGLVESEISAAEEWLGAFERLAERRPLVLDLWSELSRHLPNAIYYERIAAQQGGILITGITASSPELASYLRRLEASASFSSPRLIDLEDHPSGHRFAIEATLRLHGAAQ